MALTKITGEGVGAIDSLTVNRATSDGDIIELQKDGSTAGTIGSEGGDALYIQSGTTSGAGLHMHPTAGNVNPARNGAKVDNAIDLGRSTHRFKDLYLGGNLYIGGTGSANALDDYETGTFTPLMLGGTTNPSSTVAGSGEYVKIGNLVHIYIRFYNVNTTGASGYVRITGQPFTGNPTNQPVNMMSYDFDFGTRTSLTGEVNASEINGVISGDDAGWGLLNFGAGTARYLFLAGTYITS